MLIKKIKDFLFWEENKEEKIEFIKIINCSILENWYKNKIDFVFPVYNFSDNLYKVVYDGEESLFILKSDTKKI